MTVPAPETGESSGGLLSPMQRDGIEWLSQRPRRYLADPPGFGKTRQLLGAAGEVRLLVVAPATIRDAKVWENEAAKVGWEGDLTVSSYHSLKKTLQKHPLAEFDAAVFDEAHHLKEVRTPAARKRVGWSDPALAIADRVPVVYQASGTPAPNTPVELWAGLRIMGGPDTQARWSWINQWFELVPTQFNPYGVPGALKGCSALHGLREDCEHWQAFRAANMEGWFLARPESALDLPPLVGYDTPLWCPMTAAQKRAYVQMRKEFLADLPEGMTLEALTNTAKYVKLRQLSTGLSSADPEVDLDDRNSGKLATLAAMLDDQRHPSVVTCYFRNTAVALQRVLGRLGVKWAAIGAATSPKAVREAIEGFQNGDLDVLLGSIEVIKEGITLTAGDTVHLVERSWRADTNHQVTRRVMRRGQRRTVNARQYLTPGTADEAQWEGLHDKIRLVGKVDPTRLV